MAEINFKFTTADSLDGKTVSEEDLIAMNSQLGNANADAVKDKLGSTYKGTHIIGTTEAEKLCLNKDIKVMGVTVGNLTDGVTLKEGDSLQEILQKILCKTIDVKAQAPTAALTPNQTTSLEYGSKVTATPMTITLTQGKFVGDTGYSYSKNMDCKITAATIDSADATIAANGLTATYTVPGFTLTAAKTVKGTASVGANTVVPVKNDGTNSSVTYAGGVITCSGQRTWNPVYKAFVGYNAAKTIAELNSTAIRNLNAAKVDIPIAASAQTIVGASVKKSDGKSIIIACPPGYKLTGIQNGLGASILGNFTVSGTVSVNCADNADAAKDYTVYIYPIGNGAVVEYKNVTIGKA